jgi:multidrug efflux pump
MSAAIAWAVAHGRMMVALLVISVIGGFVAYVGLPKEGSPNIDIPVLYVSVPLPGVSASDSERLMVRPLESKLRTIEGLKEITGIASEGHAGILLEFDFDWNKTETVADVRALVDEARAEMPADIQEPKINEINLAAFPVVTVTLSGAVPERTLQKLARDMQRELEMLTPVLEVGIAGKRDEMVEILVDPLLLEAYNVTAQELLNVVARNNRLVAAGAVRNAAGQFSVRLPGNFRTPREIYETPVKVAGDRVVTIGDIATINRTFEDPESIARFNGQPTVGLQVSKRNGENIIETVAMVKARVAEIAATWPEPLREGIAIAFSLDESRQVVDMVAQLEGSVLLAVALVILVVVLTLGSRSAVLVGLTVPTSFLLSFALLALFGMSVNNMVMFGLILAVGMLVDSAIVVGEYADVRLAEGATPEVAYSEAAQRMAWPIVSSTATTLCAFLPMLFWPGLPGQFMSNLPITLIFVLSASTLVALVFMPVLGEIMGRAAVGIGRNARGLWEAIGLRPRRRLRAIPDGQRRTWFGRLTALVVMNPVGPFLAIGGIVAAMMATVSVFGANNRGVEFFVDIEPERAIVYVRGRGNLSIEEKDRLVAEVERRVLAVEGLSAVFSFTGKPTLRGPENQGPKDAIGQVQVELAPWGQRPPGREVIADLTRRVADVPGVMTEVALQKEGPQQGKAIQLRLESDEWDRLVAAATKAADVFRQVEGLVDIDDTRPLPGIDWDLSVDREAAGRYGADIATIGVLVQLITRGALLDVIRPDDSDDELDIRVRFPGEDRVLSTLDGLRIRTEKGLVPLSNFIVRTPVPALAEISRFNGTRYMLVRADVAPGVNVNEKIAEITGRLKAAELPPVKTVFQGDQEEQAESQRFLMVAFSLALGMIFAILLAQFNSLYNSALVLSAVVMSVAGVMIGMLVMDQTFSIIMTGTGVVALAGIVVNNNIVLIDTYQAFARTMPRLEAIVRTAEQRIRPVMLTTITTMAGLAPMMFAASIDIERIGEAFAALMAAGPFSAAGWAAAYGIVVSWGAPAALWWVQLSTAVVFGLGIATVLTLIGTPAALAARVWFWAGVHAVADRVRGLALPRVMADRRLARAAARTAPPEIAWPVDDDHAPVRAAYPPRAFAEAAE